MLSFSVPLAEGLRGGWEIMAAILLRSTLSFLAVLWLVNVTPFDELLRTLRRLWVPAVLVAMLAFMHRYVFVLWDEQDRMRRARAARTFRAGSLWSRWTTAATQIGMLLLRSMQRAERVHKAMLARGWDGRVRTLD
ncbi:MAG: energy-coupling factor transporter transmembrane component T family protein, partial [Planctomycetaceae bacterium]